MPPAAPPPAAAPAKPERPLASDCCDSGCTECVFTLYERALAEWAEAQAAGVASLAAPAAAPPHSPSP